MKCLMSWTLAIWMVTAASAHAGQEVFVPLDELVRESWLIGVIDVRDVTRIDVQLSELEATNVFVVKAEVAETIKSDRQPPPVDRMITIVGSTIPNSTAVWRPIEKRRYLAFLKPEQGHYRYGVNARLRPVTNGTITWYELDDEKPVLKTLSLEEAIKRVRQEMENND